MSELAISMNKFKFFDYQERISEEACSILRECGVVYLAMGMRTGKTLTALLTAERLGVRSALFLTKKRVIKQVYEDYAKYNFSFHLYCTNYEQIKNVQGKYDLVIVDEAHNFGAFPKPSLRQKLLKELVERNRAYVILMSGTPCPESVSQIYHQFDISYKKVFPFKNFYQFAHQYVNVYERRIGTTVFKMYDRCSDDALRAVQHLFITYEQEQADIFTQKNVFVIGVSPENTDISGIVESISEYGYYEDDKLKIYTKNISDEMQRCWQLSGGGFYFDDDKNYNIVDNAKALWIKEFRECAVVFYKFKFELDVLKAALGAECSDDVNDKGRKKFILLQIQSGREGVTLADYSNIIYYNLDFSYTSWVQSQDRCTARGKERVNIYILQYKGNEFEKALLGILRKKRDFNKEVYLAYKRSL